MKRALGAVVLIAAVSVAALFWLRSPRPKPETSFLVIVVDSMRADHIGAYGYPRATTPRIDALSRSGLTFDKAFTQAPWTKPSVASIFTSTYISVHHVLYSKDVIEGKNRSDVLSDKFLTLAEAMRAGGFATGGFGQKIHLVPEFGFDQGFQGYDMHAGHAEGINRRALAWLHRTDPDRFFMYLHYNDPHYPYKPPPEDSVFGATTARVQINGETKRAFRNGTLKLTSEDMTQLEDLYDGEILHTDRHLGKLIDAVQAQGYSNLLIIVTADHGEEFLDHGDITHGHSLFGELVHVPFIISGTALPPALAALRGRHIDAPVQLIDIMPTLLGLAGLPEPPGLQGRSIMRQMETAGVGTDVFTERRDVGDVNFSEMVFDGRWKLIEDATRHRTLLFDLTVDPGETFPLQDRSQRILTDLRSRLRARATANHALYDLIKPESTTPLDPETEQRLRSLGYID